MSKIISIYENDIEKTWYISSNIFYSECDDTNNIGKTIRITFNNGNTYQYENVNVYDYISLRDAESQGKFFHKIMRSYDVKKIDGPTINELKEKLAQQQNPSNENIEEKQNSIIIDNNYIQIIKDGNTIKDIPMDCEKIDILRDICLIFKINFLQN